MKKLKVILGVVATVVVFLFIISVATQLNVKPQKNYASLTQAEFEKMAEQIDYDKYNPDELIAANEDNGWYEENIIGDTDAPITVFEMADFACSACASWNEELNELIEGEFKGKVKIVYREFLRVEASIKSTAAAFAAAKQGAWKEYKDLLFENQSEWMSLSDAVLQRKLEEYFKTATNGKGDLAKFREDFKSEAAAKHSAFNYGLADLIDLTATPTFRMDGVAVEGADLLSTIRKKIAKL